MFSIYTFSQWPKEVKDCTRLKEKDYKVARNSSKPDQWEVFKNTANVDQETDKGKTEYEKSKKIARNIKADSKLL